VISDQDVLSKADDLISTTLLKRYTEAQASLSSAEATLKRWSATVKESKKRLRLCEQRISAEAVKRSSSFMAPPGAAKSGAQPTDLRVRANPLGGHFLPK